jgi:hypothetical protein
MVKLIEQLINVVITNKRKMLVRKYNAWTKMVRSKLPCFILGVHGCNAVGEQTEPKSSDKLSTGNVVSP